MVEFVIVRYTRLFDVRLLHHFWLDDGATVFDRIPSTEDRSRRLLTYDARTAVAVEPSADTARLISGLSGVFRTGALGFFLAVAEGRVVPGDAVFGFFVTAVDPQYADYTALTLRSQAISDVADLTRPSGTRSYKANVPVLSNLTGVARGTGAGKRLYLSTEYGNQMGAIIRLVSDIYV